MRRPGRSIAATLIALVSTGAGCSTGHEPAVRADDAATAHYIANAGVLVRRGETAILFDPLFEETFGIYEAVPASIREALFAGEPPFDGIDAVFVSHHHDDHVSPAELRRYLLRRPEAQLVAPAQAVAALRAARGDGEPIDPARITAVALDHGDEPLSFAVGELRIGASRIAHAGWPERHASVENIAFRVTLDEGTTVVHLGDADTRDEHYAAHGAYWSSRPISMAFPPYWYLLDAAGRSILAERLRPAATVGVHVPAEVPDDPAVRDEALRGVELFVRPGETREIPAGR